MTWLIFGLVFVGAIGFALGFLIRCLIGCERCDELSGIGGACEPY